MIFSVAFFAAPKKEPKKGASFYEGVFYAFLSNA